MPVLDPESEAILRRVEASVDVDDAWAAVHRRSNRARATTVTRRLAAAAAVVLLLGGIVAIRAADRSDTSLDVGSQQTGDLAAPPDAAPTASGSELPFLVPGPALGTVDSMSVSIEAVTRVLPPGVVVSGGRPATPAGIYASPDDAGPLVVIQTAASAPTTVGTGPSLGGEPFTAGPWHGTVEVTGSPGHEVRTVVVNDGSPAGEVVVLTVRQVDEAELVQLVAGLHRTGADGAGLRLADDSGLALVSDAMPRPNGESWRGYWDVDGSNVEVIDYRETGNPRFIDRFAASPTMTRITVGGRPGAVFESGGYTVFSWMPTAYDVVEMGVGGTGPDVVARAAALGRGSRSVTGAELVQQFPGLVVAPADVPALAAPLQQGTPLPPGAAWSEFPLSTNPVAEGDLRVAMTEYAACSWITRWREADAAGDGTGADAARAALAGASDWAALPDSSWGPSVAADAEQAAPPGAGMSRFNC